MCHVWTVADIGLQYSKSVLVLHFLEITGFPLAVEGRGLRPIDAEIDEPALAGYRFDPLCGFGTLGVLEFE